MSLKLNAIDFNAKEANNQFIDSLLATGFAVLKNHPVSNTLVNKAYEDWKEFFMRSDKMDYLYDKHSLLGYFPFRSENAKYTSIKNLMEYYHYRPNGCFPTNMRNNTHLLYESLNVLGGTLLKWIEIHLSEKIIMATKVPLHETIKNSNRTIMRFLHYPPLSKNQELGAMRSAPHQDINLLTLLPAATTKGLQLQDHQRQWHDVPCDVDTIIVNSGEMLAELTQGYFHATTHQVVNPEGELAKKSRLSMPLFLHPRDEIIFPSGITAYDFLMNRISITVS